MTLRVTVIRPVCRGWGVASSITYCSPHCATSTRACISSRCTSFCCSSSSSPQCWKDSRDRACFSTRSEAVCSSSICITWPRELERRCCPYRTRMHTSCENCRCLCTSGCCITEWYLGGGLNASSETWWLLMEKQGWSKYSSRACGSKRRASLDSWEGGPNKLGGAGSSLGRRALSTCCGTTAPSSSTPRVTRVRTLTRKGGLLSVTSKVKASTRFSWPVNPPSMSMWNESCSASPTRRRTLPSELSMTKVSRGLSGPFSGSTWKAASSATALLEGRNPTLARKDRVTGSRHCLVTRTSSS
mmetsp:Transcript_25643/g.55495  ORF Transcript_25643/g.55495 Transcript_25643/m.55495 type:complete len:301 (-) Transcript_25643:267-1169(-)